jgi:excisionase family DNA binding protein
MQLLTVVEVADKLQVKVWTLYKWAREGRIPSVKISGFLRFKEEDVEKLVEAGYRPAKVER